MPNWSPLNGRSYAIPNPDVVPPGVCGVRKVAQDADGFHMMVKIPSKDVNGAPLSGLKQLAVCSGGRNQIEEASPLEQTTVQQVIDGKPGTELSATMPLAPSQAGSEVPVSVKYMRGYLYQDIRASCSD